MRYYLHDWKQIFKNRVAMTLFFCIKDVGGIFGILAGVMVWKILAGSWGFRIILGSPLLIDVIVSGFVDCFIGSRDGRIAWRTGGL